MLSPVHPSRFDRPNNISWGLRRRTDVVSVRGEYMWYWHDTRFMWSQTYCGTGEQNHLMGNVSPHPRTLAWHPYVLWPCLQLSSLNISITVVPVNGDRSVSCIVKSPAPSGHRTQHCVGQGSGRKVGGSPLASSLLSSGPCSQIPSISLLLLMRETMFPTRTKWSCAVCYIGRWHFQIAWNVKTHFFTLSPSKNLDHFHSRWPFFTIFCILPPPLQYRLLQIVLYIFQLSKCGPSNFFLQLSA